MKLRQYQYLFLVLVLAYLLVVVFTPVDPATVARYHVSELKVRLIGLSISVIISVIWLVGLYGVSRFKSYSDMIHKAKEGPGFAALTNGLMVLIISLPFNALLSSLLRRIATIDPALLPTTTILRNYLPVIFQIIAFTLMARGASLLVATVKSKKIIRMSESLKILTVIGFTGLFSWVVLARPLGGTVSENYHMPILLVVLTIIVPLVYAWYLAASSLHCLYLYRKHVAGVLYKKMLSTLVAGVSVVTVVAILVQLSVSLAQSLSRLNFTPILIIVYVLIALYAVGFLLIARSARTLKKIEEV